MNTKTLFITYLSKNFTNGNRDNATNLNMIVMDLSQTNEGMKYMKAGRKAFEAWAKNKPESSAELNRLLLETVNV